MINSKISQKYPPPNVIYIDVDGTLIQGEQVNMPLVKWAREKHNDGYQIIVWSSRGEGNARAGVLKAGIGDIVTHTLSKPGHIVDDQGWSWTKFTVEVGGFKSTAPKKRMYRKKTTVTFSD